MTKDNPSLTRIQEIELELWLVVEALFDNELSDNGAYKFQQALANRDKKLREAFLDLP